MMTARIGRLHVITDVTLQSRWSHAELACMASEAGADVVQYRDKQKRPAAHVEVARALHARLPDGVHLIVNDHVDVVQQVGAYGVHLGAQDLPVRQARRLLGSDACIGATANSLQEARQRFEEPIDYLGVGPVFGTTSKAHPAPRLGLDALARIVGESPVPVIAIGGIEPRDVEAVLQSGAHGIAVLGGVVCQPDPRAAVRRYRHALDAALRKWGEVGAEEAQP
jgi:thiamine-phosphate diphosphorylase